MKTIVLILLVCLFSPLQAEREAVDPQGEFWENLLKQCGLAFQGRLTERIPEQAILQGPEVLVAHFRRCEALTIRIPFHIETEAGAEWDRSRTWVLIRHQDRLELRHDHRRTDGVEDEVTWYGGFTETPGSANIQEFVYYGRQDPAGRKLGWRIEIHPGKCFVYGTFRSEDWTWRLEFDLQRQVVPPPPPWGHE